MGFRLRKGYTVDRVYRERPGLVGLGVYGVRCGFRVQGFRAARSRSGIVSLASAFHESPFPYSSLLGHASLRY